MHITAQRVLSARGEQGVNTFVYEHGAIDWPEHPTSLLDDPQGILTTRSIQVHPGGNQVRSYLDIVTPDRPTPFRLQALWNAIRDGYGPSTNRLPATLPLGESACRLNMELGLATLWEKELAVLLQRVAACMLDYPNLSVAPRAYGLSPEEQIVLSEAAGREDTATVLQACRALARSGRIAEIVAAIDIYCRHCESNRTPMRNYLAAQIPAIVASHYFPALGSETFNAFIAWSTGQLDWSRPLLEASSDGEALQATVESIALQLP